MEENKKRKKSPYVTLKEKFEKSEKENETLKNENDKLKEEINQQKTKVDSQKENAIKESADRDWET